MTRVILAAIMVSVVAVPHVSADETYKGIEYISGQPGFTNKMFGNVVISDREITFAEAGTIRKRTFTIPLASVTKAANTIDTNGPNPGAVVAFGVLGLASKRHDEYVYVHSENATTADVVTFKVKKNTAQSIAAKIEFAAKKARIP